MEAEQSAETDFRFPSGAKMAPRAVADGGGGTIVGVADVSATPERVFDALSTDQVERWWRAPEYYFQRDWTADLRVAGPWSAEVVWADAKVAPAEGEFCEVSRPGKLVMTRRFGNHLLMWTREMTMTHRIQPREEGTRLTVRDAGFIGRAAAADGNAEHWERVLTWLDAYIASI
jgi:uncharacterized protein YndB with AHSA1/START domain